MTNFVAIVFVRNTNALAGAVRFAKADQSVRRLPSLRRRATGGTLAPKFVHFARS